MDTRLFHWSKVSCHAKPVTLDFKLSLLCVLTDMAESQIIMAVAAVLSDLPDQVIKSVADTLKALGAVTKDDLQYITGGRGRLSASIKAHTSQKTGCFLGLSIFIWMKSYKACGGSMGKIPIFIYEVSTETDVIMSVVRWTYNTLSIPSYSIDSIKIKGNTCHCDKRKPWKYYHLLTLGGTVVPWSVI